MFCSNCERELMPEAVFCIYCGTPVVPLVVERVSLKPGMGHGIASLVWAVTGWSVALTYHFLVDSDTSVDLFVAQSAGGLWLGFLVFVCSFLIDPFCAIAGIFYGIKGRNTKGRYCAYTGLVLAALLSPPMFLFILAYIMLAEYW